MVRTQILGTCSLILLGGALFSIGDDGLGIKSDVPKSPVALCLQVSSAFSTRRAVSLTGMAGGMSVFGRQTGFA